MKIAILLISTLVSINTWAATDLVGAVSTATGGSGRAAIEPVDGVLMNPALISGLPTKFFTLDYTKDRWGITLADNGQDALFPAALSFVKTEVDDFKTQQLALALSYNYKKIVSVGLSASMLEYDQTFGVLDQKYRQTVADLGTRLAVSKNIDVGLVFNGLFASKTELAEELQRPKTTALGTSLTYQNFARFRFDIESAPDNKFNRLVYMGGAETYMNDWIVMRVGYQNNNVLAKNYVTAGIGFAGPQFGLHYGYISNVADKSEDKHLIDLGIPF